MKKRVNAIAEELGVSKWTLRTYLDRGEFNNVELQRINGTLYVMDYNANLRNRLIALIRTKIPVGKSVQDLADDLRIANTTLRTYMGRPEFSKYKIVKGKIVNYDMDLLFKLAEFIKNKQTSVRHAYYT